MKMIKTYKKGNYGVFIEIQDQYFLERVKRDLKNFSFDFIDWATDCVLVQISISNQEIESVVLESIVNHWNNITFQCEECNCFEYIDNKNEYKCNCNKLRCEECYKNATRGQDDEMYCEDCVEAINDLALGDLI